MSNLHAGAAPGSADFATMVLTTTVLTTSLGCAPIKPMDSDLPCREAGYAIAARTAECTGDGELAQARYEQFRKEFECIEWKGDDPRFDETGGPEAEDLFSCAFTIRNLPCETVKDLGGDLSAWLATDPGCSWVVKGGGA